MYIANFGLTKATSMFNWMVYEDGVCFKFFPSTFSNIPKLDWTYTVNVRRTRVYQRTHIPIDILLCETDNTSNLISGWQFSNKIAFQQVPLHERR